MSVESRNNSLSHAQARHLEGRAIAQAEASLPCPGQGSNASVRQDTLKAGGVSRKSS
jgi:hypothetical protein